MPRNWTTTLPLAACDLTGDELTIELRSTAVRPRADSRVLGVAVRTISLQVADGPPPPERH